MSDKTAHEAMLEMGQLADPAREMVRRMIAEFGDQHYHTCPADDDSGPCDCFAGHLIKDARAFLAEGCEHPESKLRVGPRVPMRWGSAYSQHCECGAWRILLHRPGIWRSKEEFEAALVTKDDQ